MVTPTFAAGLGVVIAAVLVYPMSRTVFRYTSPVQQGKCPQAKCSSPGSGLDGPPAAAHQGRRLMTPPTRKRAQPHNSSSPAAPPASPSQPSAPRVQVTYRTVTAWEGGFIGQIIITFPAGASAQDWRLEFTYRAASIQDLWGGAWSRLGQHRVVITPQSASDATQPQLAQVMFRADGPASPPARCRLDGHPCHFTE